MRIIPMLIVLAATAAPAGGLGAGGGAACAQPPAPLPAELAGWTSPAPLASAAKAGDLSGAALPIGGAVTAALHQTSDVTYVVPPEKPGGSVSHGGMFSVTVEQAGTYVVALGSGAWIDLLKGKTPAVSTAHGRGSRPAPPSARWWSSR